MKREKNSLKEQCHKMDILKVFTFQSEPSLIFQGLSKGLSKITNFLFDSCGPLLVFSVSNRIFEAGYWKDFQITAVSNFKEAS